MPRTSLSSVHRWASTTAGLAMLLVTAAACSSNDGASESAISAPPAASAAPVTSPSPGDGSTAVEPTDTAPSNTGGGEFCEQIRSLDQDDGNVDDFGDIASRFDRLIESAPEELRDDLDVVIAALAELSDLDEEDPESFATFFEVVQRPEFVEASENLEGYGVDECGIEPTTDEGLGTTDDGVDDPAATARTGTVAGI